MELRPAVSRPSEFFEPLDEVTAAFDSAPVGAELVVLDAAHREYVRLPADGGQVTFTVAGALGKHAAVLFDSGGRELDRAVFTVDCRTHVSEEGGWCEELLDVLDYTMNRAGAQKMARVDGKTYSFFVRWLRDHVHTLKGNKYLQAGLKSGIELYLDTQCENGMVWDNVQAREPRPNYWEFHFKDEFLRRVSNGRWELKRIPVEADVEYLLVEGIYYTWKASGDTGWMEAALPKAARALRYCMSDRYRWSEKFRLVKRGYTIDTWDFLVAEDAAIYGHPMVVGPKTPFGIMHGDNTGLIAACRQMAEMLRAVGRDRDAEDYLDMARQLKECLDRVAWNGRFYRHRVPEGEERRDLGVDESEQISLSNTYALNRGIDHEQCVAIIRQYQALRERLPHGSPGEWYAIWPPFGKGFDRHCAPGEYMNGGVLTIAAGELAHGAFEHGFEDYGVDILRRVLELARSQDGYLPCTWKGFLPEPPKRSFTPLDLRSQANVDFHGETPGRGWTMESPDNDLRNMPTGRQTFCGVPFDVIDPAQNDRRACVALSRAGEPFVESAVLDVGGQAAGSIYFLHAASRTGDVAGDYTVRYTDGTCQSVYLRMEQEITGWWMPHDTPLARLAWWGPNGAFTNVGVVAYGWQNPRPDRPIAAIEMNAPKQSGILLVLAVTLSSGPVYFEPSPISYGIPDNWGAAAVLYALIEGLAGVVDRGLCFDVAQLSPRWPAAGAESASVTVKYPESAGYAAYRYRHDGAARRIELVVTGSGELFQCHVLLPAGATGARRVTCGGQTVPFRNGRTEGSGYVDFELRPKGAARVTIAYGADGE